MIVQIVAILVVAAAIAFLVGYVSDKPFRRIVVVLWALAPTITSMPFAAAREGAAWVPVAAIGSLVMLVPWAVAVLIAYSWSRERQARRARR
jgi:hypothetical protein